MKWLLDVEVGKGKGVYQVVRDRLWYVPTWQDDTRGSTPCPPYGPILYNVYQCTLNYMPAVQYIIV